MGMYYFFMFGIFLNVDFNALLACLDIPPSSQAAARAQPGEQTPSRSADAAGKELRQVIICDSHFQGENDQTSLHRPEKPC